MRKSNRGGEAMLEVLERRTFLSTSNLIIDNGGGGGDGIVERPQIRELVNVGGTIYTAAGRSLLKFNPADGISAVVKTFWRVGTYKVTDGDAGFTSAVAPSDLTNVNGTLYFVATDGVHGRELWKSDGTDAGTVMVKDLNAGAGDSSPTNMVSFGGKVYFTAAASSSDLFDRDIWSSDGTAAGTKLLLDLPPDKSPFGLRVVGTKLFFQTGLEVYRSNGTTAGTAKIADLMANSNVASAGDNLYLLEGNEVNFLANETVRRVAPDGSIATIFQGAGDYLGSPPPEGAALGDRLIFSAATGTRGKEVWITDGTAAGTHLVKDINPGPNSSGPSGFLSADDGVYFRTDFSEGIAAWKTDGTAAGTVAIPLPGADSPILNNSVTSTLVVGKKLYFGTLNTGSWVTDGTAAGTVQLSSNDQLTGVTLATDSRTFLVADQVKLRKIHDGKLLGVFSVATPRANLFAPPLAASGQKSYAFDVTFTSALALRLFGMDGSGDAPFNVVGSLPLFRVTGPNGFSSNAFYAASDRSVTGNEGLDGAIRTVKWAIGGPGGTWDAADAGTYTISLINDATSGAVRDLSSNAAPGAVLGTFNVAPPATSTITLAGSVFDDTDQDGTRDASEAGLKGYQVFIDSTPNSRLDTGEATAMTDSRGRFAFTGLPAGSYRLRIADAKAKVETTGLLAVSARAGETVYTNFGLIDGATVTGKIFFDENANSVFDTGDLLVADRVVWSDLDGDEQLDSFEPSTLSDKTGHYTLTVPPGVNHLRTTVLLGRRYTLMTPTTQLTVGQSASVDMATTAKAYITGNVFQDLKNPYTSLVPMRAQVYLDLNDNGKLDAGEPSVKSGSSGRFRMDNLDAGSYRVRVNPPAGYLITAGAGYRVKLAPAGSVKRTFVLTQGATYNGTVFDDRNLSFHQDTATEPGVIGRSVFLDLNFNGALDTGEPAAVTDSLGHYSIAAPAGTYEIQLAPAPGWRMARGKSYFYTTITPGQTITTDFPQSSKALIVGNFYLDANADHLFNHGLDQQVSGVAYLDLNKNAALDAGEPVASGSFSDFSFAVAPGTYDVRINSFDGDVYRLVGPKVYTVSVSAAEIRTGVDFELKYR